MLHIHNGESTAGTLKEVGLPGEHFAFNEVLVSGPTPARLSADEWRKVRATFLADEYGVDLEACERDLAKQAHTLKSFASHAEVTLWFEHDMFCQINLIYLLDWFSKQPKGNTRFSLICIGEFHGIEDFRGLGQLTGEQLASLFDTRHELTDSEFNTAARAWAAYCASDPRELDRVIRDDTTALPFLRQALILHLSRFPSVRDGLGRIANIALALIEDRSRNFKSLFPSFAKKEPVFGLGDSQFWSEIKRLATAREPLVTIKALEDRALERKSNWFHDASIEITETGKRVLAGEQDFIEINGIDLWLGGVHLVDGDVWRWDEQQRSLIRAD